MRSKPVYDAGAAILANIGNQVRTPINGILGLLEMALDTKLAADQRALLEECRLAAETLETLPNNLVTYARRGSLHMDARSFAKGALDDRSRAHRPRR